MFVITLKDHPQGIYSVFDTDDKRIVPLFEQRYQTSIQTVRNRARRFRRDDMTRPASPAGADNTVVDGSN